MLGKKTNLKIQSQRKDLSIVLMVCEFNLTEHRIEIREFSNKSLINHRIKLIRI